MPPAPGNLATVTILSNGAKIDQAYEFVGLDITREVNRIPHAQIVLIDGDLSTQTFPVSDSATFEPGAEIEIKIRYEETPSSEKTVFKGLVVGQTLQADTRGVLLTVELKDKALKMTVGRKSQIFENKTDDNIIKSLISAAGLTAGTVASTTVTHPQMVQYNATDWDFILSRAEANGLWVAVQDGTVNVPQIAISGSPKLKLAFGIDDVYGFEIEANAANQYPAVQTIAWDVKGQKLTKASKAKDLTLSQGNLQGKNVASSIGIADVTLASLVPLLPAELTAWADGTLARSRLDLLRGRIAIPGVGDLNLLDLIELENFGTRFNGKTLITGIRHRVDGGGWHTDLQIGFSAEPFSERSDIVEPPAAGLLPGVNGLQLGVVLKIDSDPDNEFRVQVELPGIPNSKLWARLAFPDAGKSRGYFFYPQVGDEVIIGFLNDDPRQAVILGSLYGSKNTPAQQVDAKNLNKGITSAKGSKIYFLDDDKSSITIETPAAQKIVLDDKAESIQIIDKHGNEITLSKDGVTIVSAKDLKIEASGKVEIKGQKVDIK